MKLHSLVLHAAALTLLLGSAFAADQTVPGAGNSNAVTLANKSPLVQSAYRFLAEQAWKIGNNKLRLETIDAITNPDTCVTHRAGLTDDQKNAIVQKLIDQKLVNPSDASGITGGVKAGVFPPVLNDGSDCPKLPQRFFSAPGSVFAGHHSYPGGLAIHEANNDVADFNLANEYRGVYGHPGSQGLPTFDRDLLIDSPQHEISDDTDIFISEDIIIGAPIWHDWAKPIVFQWNADGTEFTELNFGGFGTNDNNGSAGDSRTGGHHIITIAETMKRGLSPAFVVTVACAHSAPTSGNEYKVVNWLRAGAIIAQVDPVAQGYLYIDKTGNPRLPALRQLGNNVDLNAAGQTNVLAECTIHNLSDADFTYSGPAVGAAQVLLQTIAKNFGYNPADTANYNNKFRNPVLSYLTGERLLIIYSKDGIAGVTREVQKLRDAGVI